jgi:hypothetical protein
MVWELLDGTKVNFSSCIFNYIKFQKPNETMVNAFGINLCARMNYRFTRIDKSHHNPNLRKGIPYNIIYINIAKIGSYKNVGVPIFVKL